ncbi:CaiF/GrlA family transcriptional regulator [Salmonella enterica]|nr:CaiF/GrlA family transcriptional regulator [Salmonella enterica]EDS0990423.1 CaiF/GrlA family transcriptional regulator [Salmonella enterica]
MDTRISHRPPGPHRIPDILQDAPYRDLPLYMLVAWWVYRQTVPVSVRDVSEAFHISARRAGDLLLYLMNSVSHVQCTRVWQAIPGGGAGPGEKVPAGPPPGAVTGHPRPAGLDGLPPSRGAGAGGRYRDVV